MMFRRRNDVDRVAAERSVDIHVDERDHWFQRTLLVIIVIIILLLLLAQTGLLKWRTTVPGSDSSTVVTGAPGRAGADGADGADGVAGQNGADGLNGADGSAGADGAAGIPGPAGADGVPGANGAPGAQGPPGPGISLGSGTGTITTCDDDVTVALRSYWNPAGAPAGFFVQSIQLSDVATACNGRTLTILLTDSADNPLVTLTDVTIALSSGSMTLSRSVASYSDLGDVRSTEVVGVAFEITN